MAFNVGGCKGLAGPGAPFPQWTVVASAVAGGTTGVVGKVTNPLEKALVETTAFPSRVYFFTSQQAAQNCVNASGGAVSPPLQGVASGGQGATNTVTGAGVTGLDWLKFIADFFHRLTEPQTWVRVAEFAVGGMLIYVGIKATVAPGLPSAKSARKAGTVTGGVIRKTYQAATPTGRATRVITKHKARVKASDTRQRARNIRGKQREFKRRELYP
jgi:hypothetical protein